MEDGAIKAEEVVEEADGAGFIRGEEDSNRSRKTNYMCCMFRYLIIEAEMQHYS